MERLSEKDEHHLCNGDFIDEFYKKNPSDCVWWTCHLDEVAFKRGEYSPYLGEHLFSFDKKVVFNLFADYPYKLTPEQKEIFDKENPYWKEFFSWRLE